MHEETPLATNVLCEPISHTHKQWRVRECCTSEKRCRVQCPALNKKTDHNDPINPGPIKMMGNAAEYPNWTSQYSNSSTKIATVNCHCRQVTLATNQQDCATAHITPGETADGVQDSKLATFQDGSQSLHLIGVLVANLKPLVQAPEMNPGPMICGFTWGLFPFHTQ